MMVSVPVSGQPLLWWVGYNNYITYIILFITVTFINKYVLSVLRFTYPTIFQGWQVLVGIIILRGLSITGHIEVKINNLSRLALLLWLPAAVFFTISIYTGSVALSLLPVPIFLSVSCLISTSMLTIDCLHGNRASGGALIWAPMVTFWALLSAWTDPKFSVQPYLWMGAHIVSLVCYRTYDKLITHYVTLGALEKLVCNYGFSVLVLTPCSYLLGDVIAARTFEFFYFYRFYIGCIGSGVSGVLLALCGVSLTETKHNPSLAAAVSKIAASVCSLVMFDFIFNIVNVSIICLTLCSNLAMAARMVNSADLETTFEETGGNISLGDQYSYMTKKEDDFENNIQHSQKTLDI